MTKHGASDTKGKATLVEGTVWKTLLKLGAPMIVGIMAIMMLNVVDTWFVGQLGVNELAAMSFTFPVVMFVASMTLGLGIGTTSVVSRLIGSGNLEGVRRIVTDALLLAVSIVLAIALAGSLTIDPLFTMLGATDEMLPIIRDYMSVWYFGVVFLVVPMVGNGAIRATGDTRTPAWMMLASVAVNLALDPLLIFGVGEWAGLGVAGAAWATLAARALTLFIALHVLIRREKLLVLRIPKASEVLASWREILRIGIPTSATNVITPVSMGVLTGMVSKHGDTAVAAFGAGGRIESLALLVPFALTAALSPFVGQNWGANRHDRVREALSFSQKFSFVWSAAVYGVIALTAPFLASLFAEDQVVIGHLTLFLWIVPASHGFQSLLLMSNTVFNAIGSPWKASALSLMRAFVLLLPIAWLGEHFWGLTGLFGAMAVVNVLGGIIAWFWTRHLGKDRASSWDNPESYAASRG